MQETTWIERYIAPLVHAPGADGLRDDVAILSTSGVMIATMDTLVEGVHFLASDPRDTVGQKLVRVNVSDIYAKGAKPVEALLTIAWPHNRPEAEFAAFMQGMQRDFEAFNISLIGGDLVGTDGPLTLSLTLTGACFGEQPVRRSGGRAGQSVLISGEVGWGGVGLAAAATEADSDETDRYRVPRISTEADAKIVADRAASSMDVSDGLLIDAKRLAEAAGCGIDLELSQIPLAQPSDNIEKILEQCAAGDDYCILISAEDPNLMPGFTEIGNLTETPGLRLFQQGEAVNLPSTLGFEHKA
jgi:thiamine-monophosphate kinase